jgi:hypothetical protein
MAIIADNCDHNIDPLGPMLSPRVSFGKNGHVQIWASVDEKNVEDWQDAYICSSKSIGEIDKNGDQHTNEK